MKAGATGLVQRRSTGTCLTTKLPKRQPFTFGWHVADADGVAVDDCRVYATLFAGRSSSNPDLAPGAPVPAFEDEVLQNWVDGVHEVEIDRGFDPPAGRYIVVVNARRPDGSLLGHWEREVEVVVPS